MSKDARLLELEALAAADRACGAAGLGTAAGVGHGAAVILALCRSTSWHAQPFPPGWSGYVPCPLCGGIGMEQEPAGAWRARPIALYTCPACGDRHTQIDRIMVADDLPEFTLCPTCEHGAHCYVEAGRVWHASIKPINRTEDNATPVYWPATLRRSTP